MLDQFKHVNRAAFAEYKSVVIVDFASELAQSNGLGSNRVDSLLFENSF